MKILFRGFMLAVAGGLVASAQVTPGTPISASALQSHRVFLSPGETLALPITVDAPLDGSVTLDILLSQPGVSVSLQTPAANVITASNAAANGFTWGSYQIPLAPVEQTQTYFQPGWHELLRFPDAFQAGSFTVQLSATGQSSPTEVRLTLESESPAKLAVVPGKRQYWVDESPAIIAAVTNGGTPVGGMTIAATYWTRQPAPAHCCSTYCRTAVLGHFCLVTCK